MICPFCQKAGAELFHQDQVRKFFKCRSCTIIFVPRSELLNPDEEKKRYDSHQNDETDPHYQNYFLKTVLPVVRDLKSGLWGLDFGCGRTKLMEKLFREKGIDVDSYDPFYFADESIWDKTYDFVIMNEVIEHLADPAGTLKKLRSILKGPLFVRTKFYPPSEKDFAQWFYKRDLTHVQFFNHAALTELGTVRELDQDLYRIDWK